MKMVHLGLEIVVYRSASDGMIVVDIDSSELSGKDVFENEVPRIRITINEDQQRVSESGGFVKCD